MAEGNEGSGAGAGPFIAFFVGILFLALAGGGSDGEGFSLVQSRDTDDREQHDQVEDVRDTQGDTFIGTQQEEPEERTFADLVETEKELERAFRELERLREEARIAKIWGEVSPYEGMVNMQKGNVTTLDSEREYLRLQARSSNDEPINISGWLVESYVTGKGATIPFGTRSHRLGRVNPLEAILLEPRERAYVLTDESPIGASFHETKCTGYLAEFQDFLPRLTRSCPRPIDELEQFGRVDFDNDACYAFVERVGRCEVPDEDEVDDFRFEEAREDEPDEDDDNILELSRGCKVFIRDNLDYSGCVANHESDPFFDEGEWYIYLEREDHLWRSDREIIRLVDREGRTVDVIEY